MVHVFVLKIFGAGFKVWYAYCLYRTNRANVEPLCVSVFPLSNIGRGVDEPTPLCMHVHPNVKLEDISVNTSTAQVFF